MFRFFSAKESIKILTQMHFANSLLIFKTAKSDNLICPIDFRK